MDNQAIEVQEHSGGLKEAIRQIFEAVVPPDQFEQIVGPNEFSVMQQTFNQLVEEVVNENNSVLYTSIGNQIEAKDEKIRELTAKVIGIESDLAEVGNKLASTESHLRTVEEQRDGIDAECARMYGENEELQSQVADKQREIDSLNAIITNKDEEIAKLREELSKAPATQAVASEATYKPSVYIQDKIAESGSRIKTAVELAMEGRQFRGRITAGETFPEPPALPYEVETTAIITEDDRIHTSEVAATVAEETFPDSPAQHGDNKDADGSNVEPMGEAVSRAEFEARMTNVEKGMEQLMRRVFGEVAA